MGLLYQLRVNLALARTFYFAGIRVNLLAPEFYI